MPPDDTNGLDWSDAELDDWFENDFGGDSVFNDFFFRGGGSDLDPDLHPDLHFGLTAYRQLAYDDATESFDETEPWRVLSHEARMRFRRGWEDSRPMTESVIGDLAPYNALETLVPAQHKLAKWPRWVFVGGGFGILGLVLMVGFVLSSGSDGTDAITAPSSTEAAVTETAPPTTVPPVPATTTPPVPAFATVTGTLEHEPVVFPDPLFVHSVTSNFVAMEFPITGGPFVGTAVLELLHDVPSEGCQFQSVHEWEFSGEFDPATLEFMGTFTELEDETTGNCEPAQANLIYELNPTEGTFYAGLYSQDGEIRGTGFGSGFTAPVSQTLIDGLTGS